MEGLRNAAQEALQQGRFSLPDSVLSNITALGGLQQLWNELSHTNTADNTQARECLLVAHGFLSNWGERTLSDEDISAANNIYEWVSSVALPSSDFVESTDEPSSEAVKTELRQLYTVAVSVLELLASLLPIGKADKASDILLALSSFTSKDDHWTTSKAYSTSTTVLTKFATDCDASFFWNIVETSLKNRIKPLFAKTKNPSLTAAGRKNFHPVPLPRFDLSILDPEAKPWKMHEVYTTTAFSWIVGQYQPSDRNHLEAHFPLLIPPILTLIDDDSVPFKTRGCKLLSQLLIPIHSSKSDILRRTNLSSVFEDAIRPCFHSLPTITPEDDSIQLLGAAYPALRSLLQTSYRLQPSSQKEINLYISSTTKTLRDHLIPSFHHISSTNRTSSSSFASFPHPRLSTLLLNHIATTCTDLGIYTTKYLQDVIPPLYSTLSNPFGTAHLPLLFAGVSTARAVILSAHPRIWRWRGELLGAICSCWLHVLQDEEDTNDARANERLSTTATSSSQDTSRNMVLTRLKKELQGAVYLLKYALENPVIDDDNTEVLDAKKNIDHELKTLVDADSSLRDCLMVEIDPDDPVFFGLDS